jgi:hemerythrin
LVSSEGWLRRFVYRQFAERLAASFFADMTFVSGDSIRSDYGTGYEELDRDHALLVDILRRLKASTNAPPSKLNDLMLELRAYLDAHFEHEEILMDRFQYADAAGHKASHEVFRRKADDLADAIEADCPRSISTSITALEEWIDVHVADVDRRLAEYLKKVDR